MIVDDFYGITRMKNDEKKSNINEKIEEIVGWILKI